MSKKVTRLFEQFVPENYRLYLELDPYQDTFSGRVTVSGEKIGRPSKRITFHQKGIRVTSARINKHGKNGISDIATDRVNTHRTYDEVRVHTSELLYPGHYEVELEFQGKITKNMTGLYPCFFEHKGKKKTLLATQFESHHAREVFPCIDEPEAKATFDVTLLTPTGLEVLSNTYPVKQDKKREGQLTTFETTPIMSSYLLAFVIGDIHAVEAKTKNGIVMRTWGHIGQPKKFMKYANNEAVNVLDFFEEYFDTPFPLKKCDQVALPDFESGAMENWGLITYREIALLSDPDNPSLSSEQYISMVVAHELSHQWFGNLVTMKWWDDLWLNESFASLMEHVALDKLHPEWNQWEHYASADIIACSNRDIYKDVQPVRVDVNHPDEIHTLFDPAIVYAKGGRLLKMLMEYIGEQTFCKGLKIYFDTHQYSNTTRDDLWEALCKASGRDIHSFMNPWLEQSGMPIVSVAKQANTIELCQERFILDGEDKSSLWPIPLFSEPKLNTEILDKKSSKLAIDSGLPLLNVKGSGHYLIKYESKEQRNASALSIQKQIVPAEARISMINDILLIARRGDYSIVDALDVISKCQDEPREAVWALISRSLGLAMMIAESDEKLEAGLRELKVKIASKWYARLGWEDNSGDGPNTKLLRTTAIALSVSGEDKQAVDRAIKLYEEADSIENLPAEQRGIIIGAKVRHSANDDDISKLIKAYKTTHNPEVQISLASSLTHSKDSKTIKRIIAEGLGIDGFVRRQDTFRWFALLMRNRHSREAGWEWLTSSWSRIEKEFGGSKSLDHFVVYAAAPLHTKQWQKKFSDFFTPKMDQVALTRNIKIALSEIESRVAWHERDLPVLKAFINRRKN